MTRFLGTLLLLILAAGPVVAQAQERPVWLPFEEALAKGKKSGKMIVVDVWSPTCGWCRKMQDEVYTRSELLSYLNDTFETGRLDIGIRTDSVRYLGYTLSSAELSAGFGARGTPTTIFLGSDGSYITRLPGFHNFDDYMPVLKFIGTEAFREMSFEEYLEKQGAGKKKASGTN